MTKLEYDSKIYNSTAPFHFSLWKIFEAWFAFLTKKFLFLPKTLSPHMYESQQILERMCSFYLCAPDATTVAYKQKYRNSWAIFS